MNRFITLPNGLRVILSQNEQTIDVGLCVAIAAGSRYEPKEKSGISHLLEHVMSSESRRYDNRIAFAKALDALTTDFDAQTSQEFMSFTLTSRRSNILACLDLAADLIIKPRFSRRALECELQNSLEEELDRENDLSVIAKDLAEDLVFSGNNLANPLISREECLRRITAGDLRSWHRKITKGGRITIAVTGNFDIEKVGERIAQLFSVLPAGEGIPIEPFTSNQRRFRLKLISKPSQSAYMAIAFPTFEFSHKDRIALSVLNNHFGAEGRNSSRLSLKLSYEHGLVYGVSSEVWHFSDAGSFSITTSTSPAKVIDVLKNIADELNLAKTGKISQEDLWLAKTSLKNNARERRYQPATEATFFALQALTTGEIITAEQFIRYVNAVTAENIRRVAKKIFRPGKLNAVLVGAVDALNRKQVTTALKLR